MLASCACVCSRLCAFCLGVRACVRACVILVSWFTLQTISDGYAMLRAAFPGKLIIPSIGNCETFPDYQIGCGADRSQ